MSFEAEELEAALRALCEERGWKAGDLFMAIRVAVTGRTATPPLFDTIVALGLERTLERLDRARDVAVAAAESLTADVRCGRHAGVTRPDGGDPMTPRSSRHSRRGWTATWRPGRATTRPPSATCSATDATYRYHPEDEPLGGRAAIVADWLEDPDAAGTYDAHYEPLAIDGEAHVASGWTRYFDARRATLRDEYWNIYLVTFDDAGQATVVHRVVDPGPRVRAACPRGGRRRGARRGRC